MSRGGATRFTSETARAIAIEREARRREARRLAAERGEHAETAREVPDIVAGSGAPRTHDPRVESALPALSLADLVSRDGVLVYPGRVEPFSAPRTRENPGPAVGIAPPSTSAGASPGSVGGQAREDVALDRPDALAEEEREIARQAREARERQIAEAARASAEIERQRVARALVERETLRFRLARPEMARHMLPWSPSCPSEGGKCRGCGRTLPAWARAGHAVEMAEKGRERCVAWAMGIPA